MESHLALNESRIWGEVNFLALGGSNHLLRARPGETQEVTEAQRGIWRV